MPMTVCSPNRASNSVSIGLIQYLSLKILQEILVLKLFGEKKNTFAFLNIMKLKFNSSVFPGIKKKRLVRQLVHMNYFQNVCK